jgi:hypothetical protein
MESRVEYENGQIKVIFFKQEKPEHLQNARALLINVQR